MTKSEGGKKLVERKKRKVDEVELGAAEIQTESGDRPIDNAGLRQKERKRDTGVYPVLVSYTWYCTGKLPGKFTFLAYCFIS